MNSAWIWCGSRCFAGGGRRHAEQFCRKARSIAPRESHQNSSRSSLPMRGQAVHDCTTLYYFPSGSLYDQSKMSIQGHRHNNDSTIECKIVPPLAGRAPARPRGPRTRRSLRRGRARPGRGSRPAGSCLARCGTVILTESDSDDNKIRM